MLKIVFTFSLIIFLSSCNTILTKYNQESHSEFATLEFNALPKSRVEELYICQKDNTGFIRLPKDGIIKVKANEPTHIQMLVNDRKHSCPIRLNTNFSANKKYFISYGFLYQKESLAKLILAGKGRGECKAFISDNETPGDFNQLNGFPLSRALCINFRAGSIDKAGNIIKADTWIDLNEKQIKKPD